MTVESPVTLDLTQDIASQTELQLSPEEQASYQAYIETLAAAERQAVISLTQSELRDLKSILQNFDPRENAAGETIQSFIETQKTKDFSSADILAGVEGNMLTPEILDTFDTVSQNMLFGNEGMFTSLNISPAAQEIASVSFSLALLEQIQENPENLQALFTAMESGNTSEIGNAVKNFGGENIALIQAYLEAPAADTRNQLEINGEKNKIFMNMQVGTDFFRRVLTGEITPNNLRAEMEAQNSEIPLEAQMGDVSTLQDLGALTQADIDALVAAAVPGGSVDTPLPAPAPTPVPATAGEGTVPPLAPAQAAEAANALADMKPLGPFLAAILEFLKGITSLHQDGGSEAPPPTVTAATTSTTTESPTETESPVPETPSEQLISLFEGLEVSFPTEKEAILQELRGSPELSARMIAALESISSSEILEQSFSALFGTNAIDGKANEVFPIFQEAGFMNSLPEGTSPATGLVALIEEYARYRKSPGVIDQTENRTTWLAYAQTRKAAGWTQAPTPGEATS